MQPPAIRVLPFALCLLAAGCASRPLPKYEKPLARAQFQTVRTTAYTHTEGDHLQYSNRNACGDALQCGSLNSAACDWSRWPVGTVFRIQETGENYIVDDYGWALSGTNTIDLYKPSRSSMNAWGVRRIHLEIVRWGDVRRSLAILQPRSKYAHVRRMLSQIHDRYDELSSPMMLAANSSPQPTYPATAPRPAPVQPVAVVAMNNAPAPAPQVATPVRRAVAVSAPDRSVQSNGQGGFTPSNSRVQLTPFAAGSSR